MIPASDALKIALQAHQAGRLHEAGALYRQVLEAEPDNPEALHLLGVVSHQTGQHDVAVRYIQQAIARSPQVARFHNNLGEALRAQGRLAEAEAQYRQALALKPEYVDAHTNLGTTLKAQGNLEEAVAHYRKALALSPGSADAHNNFGLAVQEQGNLEVAVAQYRTALALNPALPEAHNNLGNALKAQGKLEDAIAHFRQALALNPAVPDAHNNLGIALHEQGKLEEAVAHFRQAVALRPAYPEGHHNLGNALRLQGKCDEALGHLERAIALRPTYPEAYNALGSVRLEHGLLDEAVMCCQRALALKPDFPEAHNNLGMALNTAGRSDEAVACYQRALALKPDFPEAHNNLGNTFKGQEDLAQAVAHYRKALTLMPGFANAHNNLAGAFREQGLLEEAMAHYRQALALAPDRAEVHSNLLFAMNYHPDYSVEALAAAHREWNERHARPLASQRSVHANDRDPGRRLRVGYVSGDFVGHSVSYFFEPLVAAHDRANVEVFCYSNGIRADATTARLRRLSDGWRPIVGLGDADVATLITADQIDILVDLSGHTAHNRMLVFARKPAPVQVTYLGYDTTTGLSTIDYRLTDKFLSPPETPEWFSEELVYLPACCHCYQPPAKAPPVTPLPASRSGHVTFGSFNSLAKVTPAVLGVWAEILHAIPSARLLLKDRTLANDDQQQRYLNFFVQSGIGAERITLLPRFHTHADHLALYGQVDIGLDPFPYAGCTTTCEALWMGVPVITLAGTMAHGRYGVSLLSNLGLENLVAATPAEYVEKAVGCAARLTPLADLRSALRSRMRASPLCDAKGYARGVEEAYRGMWRRWCRSAKSARTQNHRIFTG
jgi:predicted O-linked N-acetylglucosamine transferase (SPINDLY family)